MTTVTTNFGVGEDRPKQSRIESRTFYAVEVRLGQRDQPPDASSHDDCDGLPRSTAHKGSRVACSTRSRLRNSNIAEPGGCRPPRMAPSWAGAAASQTDFSYGKVELQLSCDRYLNKTCPSTLYLGHGAAGGLLGRCWAAAGPLPGRGQSPFVWGYFVSRESPFASREPPMGPGFSRQTICAFSRETLLPFT